MRGRFLSDGDRTIWIRGVTYGPFSPDYWGRQFPRGERLRRDLAAIVANGFNTLRTYTMPPRDLLDLAADHGLRILVGLGWEQHIAFLDDRARMASIVARVREDVRRCAGHPAILVYAVGNEIPGPIVRWHGARAIEHFLRTLADTVREGDPCALVTYVNYPTTEYLELPFLDLVCFNVYLETDSALAAYLARLHTLAGDRPLLITELGLDSRRHGLAEQARSLVAQWRTVFASGCAGAFVFAWTDEWHRGGFDVTDWDFGLTDRARRPKPALAAMHTVVAETPFAKNTPWPRVSVVVCSYNGARTIRDCLDGLLTLEYPDYEVIVVDDGSTDATATIAREYPFRVISTPNRGLSNARNTGLEAANGEIVAYIDDDAWPDPHWLHYLVSALDGEHQAGVGGPNLPPPGDGWIAECVAHAPGGPTHVLLTDQEAEHVPGCNMAFRKSALEAIGGFDPRFRAAGDDVDVCWRIRDAGYSVRFSPSAVVWHHRRNSVRTYWRQQIGYGRAEALLEQKWPERYNAAGHAAWVGRIYGAGAALRARARSRIYHGTWGTAPFQSVYQSSPGVVASLPMMPEWYLIVAVLTVLAGLGTLWLPLFLIALPAVALAAGAPLAYAVHAAMGAPLREPVASSTERARQRALLALMHLMQPAARLRGRVTHGLTPWRRRGLPGGVLPYRRRLALWTETWHEPERPLRSIDRTLREAGFIVTTGGDWDRWDVEVRGGVLGGARLLAAVEEHGSGRQLWRFRVSPRYAPLGVAAVVALSGLAAAAATAGVPAVAVPLAGLAIAIGGWSALESGRATAAFLFAHHVVAREMSGGAAAAAPTAASPVSRAAPRRPDAQSA